MLVVGPDSYRDWLLVDGRHTERSRSMSFWLERSEKKNLYKIRNPWRYWLWFFCCVNKINSPPCFYWRDINKLVVIKEDWKFQINRNQRDHLCYLKFKLMSGLNIVMVIAIILFARLGVRLLMKYLEMKKNDKNKTGD